jgi:hypothetical protein
VLTDRTLDVELCRLLDEATGALSRLDVETLEAVERRAAGLRVLSGMGLSAELASRHRVFGSVVRATGENLAVLERAAGVGDAGRGVERWAR